MFSVYNQKVVINCFNSTENPRIDGLAHSYFTEEFLEPLLLEQVEEVKEQIDDCDKKLVTTLDSKVVQ